MCMWVSLEEWLVCKMQTTGTRSRLQFEAAARVVEFDLQTLVLLGQLALAGKGKPAVRTRVGREQQAKNPS